MPISEDLQYRILISQAKSRMRQILDFRENRDSEAISLAAQLTCEEPHFNNINPLDLSDHYISDLLRAHAS